MKSLLKIFTALTAVVAAVSCVHEYPSEEVNPTLVDTKITLTTSPAFTHSSILGTRNGESFDCMYFVVEIHENDFGPEPLIRREMGAAKDANGSATIELNEKLAAGKYKCVAYAVAANDTDGTGSIYSLDDLSNIGFDGEYPGNTDAKESYEIRFDLDITSDEWFSRAEVSKLMSSPMGSVEVISTDVEEFIKHEMTRLDQKGNDSRVDLWQWEDYYVLWKYDLYYPVRYNAYTGLPNKAETAVSFKADIVPQSETEASLGFDYIFVNGESSQVTLSLEVYDKNNTLLNVYSGINVPLERSKTTIIRGEYLTNRKDPGIGIDPGFDGDIDINLPD